MKYGKYIYKEIDILEELPNGDIIVDYDIYEKRSPMDSIGIYRETKQITIHTQVPEDFKMDDRADKPDRIPYSGLINNIGRTLVYLYHRSDVRRQGFNTARNFGKDYTYGGYKLARQTNNKVPANFVSAQKVLSNAKAGYQEQYTEILNDGKLLQAEYQDKLPDSMKKTNIDARGKMKDPQGAPKFVYVAPETKDVKQEGIIDNFVGFDEPNRIKSRKVSKGAIVQMQINEFFPEKDDSDYDSKTFLDRISSIRSTIERSCLKYGIPLTKEIFLTNNAQPNDSVSSDIDAKFPYIVFESILKKCGLRKISIAGLDYDEEIEGEVERHSIVRGTAFRNPIVTGAYADKLEQTIKSIWDVPENARTQEQEKAMYKALGAPGISQIEESTKYTYDPIRNYLVDETMKPKVITKRFEQELMTDGKLVHQAFSGDTDFAEEVVCGDRRLFYNPKTKEYKSVLGDVLHIPLEKKIDVLYSPVLKRYIEKSELSLMTYMGFQKQRVNGVPHIVGMDDDEMTYRTDGRTLNNQLKTRLPDMKPLIIRPSGANKLGKGQIKHRVTEYKQAITSGFNLYTERTGKVLIDLYKCKNDKKGFKRDEDRGKNELNGINMDEYGYAEHQTYRRLNPLKK